MTFEEVSNLASLHHVASTEMSEGQRQEGRVRDISCYTCIHLMYLCKTTATKTGFFAGEVPNRIQNAISLYYRCILLQFI
jgi:hypothetical protein